LLGLLFDWPSENGRQSEGAVMSINESSKAAAAFEIDMRGLLGAKGDRASDVRKEPGSDYSSLVSQMSDRSVHEVDHLIAGLQDVRAKLNSDGDRLHREIEQHAALSQSIIQLTEIISDSVASVDKAATWTPQPKDAA
jgi:hypothetical protein